jgi:hypothetical protein
MDTLLPHDVLLEVLHHLDDDPVALLFARRVGRIMRDACDALVMEDADAVLARYCDALRVRLCGDAVRRRWMYARRITSFAKLPTFRCARCRRPTTGILACDCHERAAPAFPWRRVLLGPSLAALAACCLVRRVGRRG